MSSHLLLTFTFFLFFFYFFNLSSCGTPYIYIPVGPSSSPAAVSSTSISLLINLTNEMITRWRYLDSICSTRAPFALLYIYMTRGGLEYVQSNYFDDGNAMTNLIFVFASRYITAIDTWTSGGTPSTPWNTAFNFGASNESSVLQDLMLGINAHINYDLGIAVYNSGYGITTSRMNDYNRINDLLSNVTVPALCDIGTRYDSSVEPAVGISGVEDTITMQVFVEMRNNAWENAVNLYGCETSWERVGEEEGMEEEADVGAAVWDTPTTTGGSETSGTRVPYCEANHDTVASCPTNFIYWELDLDLSVEASVDF